MTLVHTLVVDADNRVEHGPHDFGIVNLATVVADVQAEDDLVQFAVLDADARIAERRRKLSQEVG